MNSFIARTLALFFLTAAGLQAQESPPIRFWGGVAVGGVNFTGTGLFKFAIVDDAGATSFWSNDDSSTAGANRLQL